MATPAAVLSILVDANTGAANANLAKTDAQLRGTAAAATATSTSTKKAGTAMKKLGTVAKWAGLAVAAGFVIEAKKAVTTTQDLTKSTISLHKNLGLTNKAASEWAGVAKARGADTTKLGMAFKTLATQISAAGHGSDAAKAIFEELGFSNKDIQKSMTDTQFAIGKVADGLNALPAGADKAAFSGKLFGRGWQTIAPILRDGSAAMQEQLDTVEKYGGVLEGKTLGAQKRLLANIRENKIAWQGFQVTLATAVTPALNVISTQFQKIAAINANKNLTGEEKWKKIADIIQRDFEKALNVIVEMIPTIASRVGEQAPKIAAGLVKGFLGANVWGKLLIGSWLISKMGGLSAISAVGKKIGARIGIGVAAGEAGGIAAGTAAGGAGAAGAGGAAAGISAGGIAAIGVAGVAAGVGVHKLMEAFGDYLDKKDAVERGTEVIAGQYGDLGKVAKQLGKQIRSTGDISERVWSKGTGTLKEAATAEVQLIVGLKNHYGSFAVAARNLSKKQRNAWIDMALSARESGDITQKQLLKLTHAFTDVGEKNRKMWKAAARVTGESVQSIKKSVGDMTVTVAKDYSGMVRATGHGLDLLGSNTNKMLQGLGVKQVKFNVTHGMTPGGDVKGGPRRQRGGPIFGSGEGDKVPAMLEPKEYVVNKKAAKKHRGLLDKINFSDAPRFKKGGTVGGGLDFALGPYTVPPIQYDSDHAGTNSHVHVSANSIPWLIGIGHKLQQMHNSVGEFQPTSQGNPFNFGPVTTTRHAHYAHDHYSGYAFDVNSLSGAESKGWESAIARVLSGGAGGAAAATVKKLKRILLKGPDGALKDVGQGALDKTLKAAQAFVDKQASKATVGIESFGASGSGTLSSGEFSKIARQAIKLTHSPNFTTGGLLSLAIQESGLRVNPPPPHDINWPSNPSMGLMQITGSNFKTYHQGGTPRNIVDPLANIAASINYQKATYGGQVTHSPYQKGGIVGPYVGSFAKGGEVAETGLAHVHKGETVVPGFKRGGTVGLHATPHHGFISSHQFDARGAAAMIRGLQRSIKRLGNAALSKKEARELHRLEGRGHLSKDDRHRRNELEHQRRVERERKRLEEKVKTLEVQRANDKEMIAEFKALRTDLKEHNRLVKTVRANEKGALQAVVNLTSSQIGAQGMVKGRNASPGRAARY